MVGLAFLDLSDFHSSSDRLPTKAGREFVQKTKRMITGGGSSSERRTVR
jgi:hypothetical protein